MTEKMNRAASIDAARSIKIYGFFQLAVKISSVIRDTHDRNGLRFILNREKHKIVLCGQKCSPLVCQDSFL